LPAGEPVAPVGASRSALVRSVVHGVNGDDRGLTAALPTLPSCFR
jgi:hypothetical protein